MRNLLDYEPPYMQDYLEIREICEAEQPEVELVWGGLESAFLDMFIDSLDEYGCSRWEKILKVTPFPSDTLVDRRFRIKTLINSQLPYTYTHVYDVLTNICGEGKFTMNLNHAQYTLSILVELTAKRQLDVVVEKLKLIIPANLILIVEIRYNQHSLFIGKFTHADLSAYTHRMLREDVIY